MADERESMSPTKIGFGVLWAACWTGLTIKLAFVLLAFAMGLMKFEGGLGLAFQDSLRPQSRERVHHLRRRRCGELQQDPLFGRPAELLQVPRGNQLPVAFAQGPAVYHHAARVFQPPPTRGRSLPGLP
ncbi:MAG: hypothetical protein HY038_07005 [Nitrospirae bacterium]|nr:hypothetical protein [Nitrospirota bacterium]